MTTNEATPGPPLASATETLRPSRGSGTFLEDLQFSFERHEDGMAGSFTVAPESLAPGTDRAPLALLASIADVMTGIPISSDLEPTVALTVDLVVRTLQPITAGTYSMRSNVVKRGRTLSVTEATIGDPGNTLGHCLATFIPHPLPDGTLVELPRHRIGTRDRVPWAPFAESLGITVPEPGTAVVDRRPYTMQPAGTIQGGVVCALAETAACSVLEGPLSDLDVRFLATVRNGPGKAMATRLDERTARVTVIDDGSDDLRTTAIALARA